MSAPVRIAMWSGPRNISTAMMRAWGSRPDTFVCDEPLYAHYLKETGLPHPGAAEIIAAGQTDWRRVVGWLTGPVPDGRAIFFQKHMAHHLLPSIDLAWTEGLVNCLLIRSPREMLASLAKIIPDPALEQTGLPQQVQLFEALARRGGVLPVLDSRDVLLDPERLLRRLCERVGVAFTEAMLHWAPGRRETDGIWAPYWYAAVEQSTGFEPWRPRDEPLPEALHGLLRDCEALYARLYEHRLT